VRVWIQDGGCNSAANSFESVRGTVLLKLDIARYQSPNSFRLSNDGWGVSVSSKLPNKSGDIFNIKCKCRVILSNFMFVQTVYTK
jgi:hypothetical protein